MISDRNRDYYAGALVIFIGAGAAVMAQRYQIGTLTRMGPGFFPFALGILLAILGVMIATTNFLSRHKEIPVVHDAMHGMQSKPDWRGWGCIIGSVLAFMFLADHAGLIAATFACVFIACWGDRTAKALPSALLAAGITAFGVFLFSYILKVQIPIVRGF